MAFTNISGTTPSLKLVTHNGKFHADEVMAYAILATVMANGQLTRTRDRKVIEEADIAFDVGGGKYDHHQRGGNGCRPDGSQYSSAGLVWRDFGLAYVSQAVGGSDLRKEQVLSIVEKIDMSIIREIDMIDNGQIKGEDRSPTSFSSIVFAMNPSWDNTDQAVEQDRFERCWAIADNFLSGAVEKEIGKIKAENLLEKDRTWSLGQILVLSQFYPWQEALDRSEHPFVFTVFGGGHDWKVQTIQKFDASGKGTTIAYLPEAWAGLNDAQLVEATGVADAVFCHNGRFIAGAKSQRGAMALAELALDLLGLS